LSSAKRVTLAAVAGSGSGTTVSVGGTKAVALALGALTNVTLKSTAPVSTLSAADWQGGSVIAPSIGNLSVGGSFDADVLIQGRGKVNVATIGSVTGGAWAVPGGIGSLCVLG